jgi:NADPH:quinone reductase-like Zn-dependent oxidoreductase
MKAIVYHQHGAPDVLRCENVPKPVPKDHEVLIKIHAAALNPLDWRIVRGGPRLVRVVVRLMRLSIGRPGVDFAGEVEAVGPNVKDFKPGDRVFGGCRGAFAEYACARESKIAEAPKNVTFEQAAALNVAGLTALQGLRDTAKVQPGQKVLVNGAAGGVGTFAVQIAKSLGAEVTGVCSTRNVEMVKSIGADAVVDYTKEDFANRPEQYDVIFECVGNTSFAHCRRVLSPNGKYIMVGAPHEPKMGALLKPIISALLFSPFRNQKSMTLLARANTKDLSFLAELITLGKLTPVIDRRYTLNDAADAFRYVETGHARGKVLIEPLAAL